MSEIFFNTTPNNNMVLEKENIASSRGSKDSYEKGNQLIEYITTNLLNKNISEILNYRDLQDHSKIKFYNKLNRNNIVKESVFIKDEEFYIEFKKDLIIISHPVWSLIGHGKTLYDALKDLTKLSYEVFKSLADDKPSELTEEANNLRNFLFKVF